LKTAGVFFLFIPPIESHFLNYAKGAAPITFGTAPYNQTIMPYSLVLSVEVLTGSVFFSVSDDFGERSIEPEGDLWSVE
jgi:hypothetical protein